MRKASLMFLDMDIRMYWFNHALHNALLANQRMEAVSHRLIYQDKVVYHIPQKELF